MAGARLTAGTARERRGRCGLCPVTARELPRAPLFTLICQVCCPRATDQALRMQTLHSRQARCAHAGGAGRGHRDCMLTRAACEGSRAMCVLGLASRLPWRTQCH